MKCRHFMLLSVCFSFLSFFQSGETMLIGAVRGGHVEIVRALLNKYADIDVRGQVGAPLSPSLLPFWRLKAGRRPSCVLPLCWLLVKWILIHGLELQKPSQVLFLYKQTHFEALICNTQHCTFTVHKTKQCHTFSASICVFVCLTQFIFSKINKLVFALSFPLQDGKTALYWAVEKGNATMVRDILQCNPDTESCTKVRHLQK